MLLAFTLLFGLSVSASAYTYDYFFPSSSADRGFGSGSVTNNDSAIAYHSAQNDNFTSLFQLLIKNFSMSNSWKYTTDQSSDASVSVGEYITYALHGLKGSITSSGTIIASNNLGSDSKDYFLTRWVNMNSNATITDANRWRVQTLSDNSQYSWLYQVASGAGSMQLLTDALMNWSNPNFGVYSPADTANYSWFNQMLHSVNSSKADTSKLATETTLATVSSRLYTLNALGAKDETLSALSNKVATESTLSSVKATLDRSLGLSTASFDFIRASKFDSTPFYSNASNIRGSNTSSSVFNAMNGNILSLYGLFAPYSNSDGAKVGSTYSTSKFSLDSSFSKSSSNYTGLTFLQAVSYALNLSNYGLSAINGNVLKLDEILSTENDRALEDATDDTKTNVTDYVSDKKSNYGDSFTISNTISNGLKPDLSTSDASSAIGGLFTPDSSDYWGWFSSATDSDLHPAASGVSTLSLDDEPSGQDVADSETVWVIDPSVTSSDLIADFFGGD